jgi:hypothetical protein
MAVGAETPVRVCTAGVALPPCHTPLNATSVVNGFSKMVLPLEATGVFRVRPRDDFDREVAFQFGGRGTVAMNLPMTSDRGSGFLSFEFGSSESPAPPVPEPGSIVLMATGGVVAAARAWTQRRRTRSAIVDPISTS